MGFFHFLKKKKQQMPMPEDINDQRAQALVQTYGFDFACISREEIIRLLEEELQQPTSGSSEYIRVLCGYLYCLGDAADAALLEKAKYGSSMDVGCMIDGEWIESLKNTGEAIRPREEIVADFVGYYKDF